MKKIIMPLVMVATLLGAQSCAGFKSLVNDLYKDCGVKKFTPKPLTGGFEVTLGCDSTALIIKKAVLESLKKDSVSESKFHNK
jgi:hypothetical protein